MHTYIVNTDTKKAFRIPNVHENLSIITKDNEKVVESEEKHSGPGLKYDDESGFFLKDYYQLSTDSTDDYEPEQGIPDIPADGTTSATITIQKYSGEDNKLTGSSHDETVHIKTDRGKLSTQSVSLGNGSATFELTSVKETVVANVEVYDPDRTVRPDTIQIQFAPEDS